MKKLLKRVRKHLVSELKKTIETSEEAGEWNIFEICEEAS